jgi:hypothetical protein
MQKCIKLGLAAPFCRYVDRHSLDRTLLIAFRAQLNELHKLAMEARDNVKFLTTLERHFKAITHGPLSGAPDGRQAPMESSVRQLLQQQWHGPALAPDLCPYIYCAMPRINEARYARDAAAHA